MWGGIFLIFPSTEYLISFVSQNNDLVRQCLLNSVQCGFFFFLKQIGGEIYQFDQGWQTLVSLEFIFTVNKNFCLG